MKTVIARASAEFLRAFCSPGNYVWKYTVEIQNRGKSAVRLKGRYWWITDRDGRQYEVDAPTVGGKRPVVTPGETFTYTTAVALSTPSGHMQGHIRASFADEDNNEFKIPVQQFQLKRTTRSEVTQSESIAPSFKDRDAEILRVRLSEYEAAVSAGVFARFDSSDLGGISADGRREFERLALKVFQVGYESLARERLGTLNFASIEPRLINVRMSDVFMILEQTQFKILILHGLNDDLTIPLAPYRARVMESESKKVLQERDGKLYTLRVALGVQRGVRSKNAVELPENPTELWTGVRGTGVLFEDALPKFIQRVYGRYIGRGLTRSYIFRKDPKLYRAINTYETNIEKLPFDIPSERDLVDQKFELLAREGRGALSAADRRSVLRARPKPRPPTLKS